jgi:hypothetical protein
MKISTLIVVLVIAFAVKLSLWAVTVTLAPQGKFENDSEWYLEGGRSIAEQGRFVIKNEDGKTYRYEMFRTPGYPLFLGALTVWLRSSLETVLFVQILLTIVAAVLTYKATEIIDPALAKLAGFIVLFDPAVTVFSLMLMTEALFLVMMSLFLFLFVKYMNRRSIKYLLFSGAALAAATYVRPISYYLGTLIAIFVLYIWGIRGWKKALVHSLVFFLTVYSLIGIWHYRNYRHTGKNRFSTISDGTVSCAGIYKSYTRNEDEVSKGLPPWAYYANTFSRTFLSLMTRPETYKYWGMKPLTIAGKAFGYPWVVFFMIGLVAGLAKMNRDKRLHLAVLVMFYFIAATIGGAFWGASARFRVPMVPFIAVIAAYGWNNLTKKRKRQSVRSIEPLAMSHEPPALPVAAGMNE